MPTGERPEADPKENPMTTTLTAPNGTVLTSEQRSGVDCYGYRFRLVEQFALNPANQRMWFADDTIYEPGQCGPYATKAEAKAASRRNGLPARAWGAGLGKKGQPLTRREIAAMRAEHPCRGADCADCATLDRHLLAATR